MTATEVLHRLLDERGVEYGSGFGGDTLWTGRDGIEWRWDKQENTLAMYSHVITPEQAIAATLGTKTCHMIYNELADISRCESCGCRANGKPTNFCPNCGRQVVSE